MNYSVWIENENGTYVSDDDKTKVLSAQDFRKFKRLQNSIGRGVIIFEQIKQKQKNWFDRVHTV